MKKNLMVIMVMVAVGMFLTACGGEYLIGGYSVAGMNIQIRSGGPSSGGVGNIGSNAVYNPARDSGPIIVSTSTSSVTTEAKDLVREVLFKSEQTWNKRDMIGYFELFHPEAKIMVGRSQKIVTKPVYMKMFPAAFEAAGFVKYESFEIEVNGLTAEIDAVASISAGGGDLLWLTKGLRLINQNDAWFIVESTFNIYFKGDADPRDRSRPRSGGDTPS